MKCPCDNCGDRAFCTENQVQNGCPYYEEYLIACDAEQEQERCEAEAEWETEAQAQYEEGVEAMEEYGGMY